MFNLHAQVNKVKMVGLDIHMYVVYININMSPSGTLPVHQRRIYASVEVDYVVPVFLNINI